MSAFVVKNQVSRNRRWNRLTIHKCPLWVRTLTSKQRQNCTVSSECIDSHSAGAASKFPLKLFRLCKKSDTFEAFEVWVVFSILSINSYTSLELLSPQKTLKANKPELYPRRSYFSRKFSSESPIMSKCQGICFRCLKSRTHASLYGLQENFRRNRRSVSLSSFNWEQHPVELIWRWIWNNKQRDPLGRESVWKPKRKVEIERVRRIWMPF